MCWFLRSDGLDAHLKTRIITALLVVSRTRCHQSGVEIKDMANYDKGMRLLINKGSTSRGFKDPYPDMQETTGWLKPSQMGGQFSATCWFYGRDIYSKQAVPRPVGLIGAYVGGTADQLWQSQDAIDKCKGTNKWNWPSNYKSSYLWNEFIVPLLRTVHSGAIWYQGEANAGSDGRQYNCSFSALIEDWRAKWSLHTDGATSVTFPFGWAQLNSDGNGTTYNNPPSAGKTYGDYGEWAPGFPSLRLAQTNALTLPNTFQAVILDTPVASGSIHSPYKQPVGARLARLGLAVAYGHDYPDYASNVALSAKATDASTVLITFKNLSGSSSGIVARTGAIGFEVLGADQVWHSTPIAASTKNSITVGRAPAGALAVRYLYYTSPCTLKPYNCPANYQGAAPLGNLSGETETTFPIGPFVLGISHPV
jgi:sialate O-acetylesterase